MTQVAELFANPSNNRRKPQGRKGFVSSAPLEHYRRNTDKSVPVIAEELNEKVTNVRNWLTRDTMPARIEKKINKLEKGEKVVKEKPKKEKAKTHVVRKHVRSRAPIPEDAQTLYAVRIPGEQDSTVKSLLKALGCTFRKIDL